jgi:uncharacterized delta-60 repeat protein
MTLVTTFGTNVKVFVDGSFRVQYIFVQADGKIVFAGGNFSAAAPTPHLALARYNADGSKDMSFGSAAPRVVTTISSATETLASVVALPDGKLLAVGSSAADGTHVATIDILRFTSDGSPDSTFGTGGVITYPNSSTLTGLALLPGNKFLVRGSGFVSRFNADGSFDTTFDGDGIRTDALSAKYLTVQPDGRYLIAGTSAEVAAGSTWTINRFNADGTVDTSFGLGGVVQTTFSSAVGITGALVTAVTLKGDGDIFAVGATINTSGKLNMAAARYAADGTQIARTLTPFAPDNGDSDAVGKDIALQPDGAIVLAARTDFGSTNPNVGLIRLTAVTNEFFRSRRNYDYNGDGRDDFTVYRPGSGGGSSHWYSSNYPYPWFTYGLAGDIITPGDYNGDGRSDLAVFRPSDGTWYIASQLSNPDSHTIGVHWGLSSDTPAAGDFDGDGKTDVAVFRPSTGIWYILGSQSGSAIVRPWGANGDRPVVGDYDRDGKDDVAIYRPSTGEWYILKSSNNQMQAYIFGASGDIPVPGDYDNDGITDISVFRPSTGVWYILMSSTGSVLGQQWGATGDVPVPGDYDGDSKTDVAIYRPDGTNGVWYVLKSSNGTIQALNWGLAGDTPIPGN